MFDGLIPILFFINFFKLLFKKEKTTKSKTM
jgi:hypothetical protein